MAVSIFYAVLAISIFITAEANSKNHFITITKDYYVKEFEFHRAEHDIVDITVPLNHLNYNNDDDPNGDPRSTIFFVLADIVDGVRDYKGLYANIKNKVTKILDNGIATAAATDNSLEVFIGATDGLYKYNGNNNNVEKYGNYTGLIKRIAKVNGSDIIYAIDDNDFLIEISNNGYSWHNVNGDIKATEIVLDYSNNLYYFYESEDFVSVRLANGDVKKIKGVPKNTNYRNIFKPPFSLNNGIPAVMNNKGYILYADGTSKVTEFRVRQKPTAYAMEATLIQYFAYNKKIYSYNIFSLLMADSFPDFTSYLNKHQTNLGVTREFQKKVFGN